MAPLPSLCLRGVDSAGNSCNQAEVLLMLSVSDANTVAMVESGALDTIALALNQGEQTP